MKEGPPVVAGIASKPVSDPAGDFASNPAFGSDRSMDSAPESNASELLSVVYDELRRLAAQKMAHERPGQTLQPTALVHEAWLRLGSSSGRPWDSREHFFAAAAEAMRRILIDRARRRARIRHGGEWTRVDAEDIDLPIAQDGDKCLRVHEALDRLALVDARKAEVVKMRVFVGMEVQEIAEVLGLSEKSVQRDWVFSKAWLSRELQRE
jgi:RNA polymerase sigma factor (TIGR02999 family)